MILAIDIGGTKTLVAVFDDNKNIVEHVKFPTPKSYDEFLNNIKEISQQLETKELKTGAIGIRGLVDRENGVLINDNILRWPNAPLIKDFEDIFGCKLLLENDTKLAGLSEANTENNKEYDKVLYFTISTGIGSVLIIKGEIDKNLINSEVGKWIFEYEGKVQTWENFASGKAIVEKYGKRASELDDQKAWENITKNLALGIINASAAYIPDLIVIGGGVGEHFDKFDSRLQEWVKQLIPESVIVPKIVKAQRSEEAVIYGCLELALQKN